MLLLHLLLWSNSLLLCTTSGTRTVPAAGPSAGVVLAEKKFTPPPDDTPPVFARPPTTPKHRNGAMRRTATAARPSRSASNIASHIASDRLRNGLRCVAFTVFFNFCARQPLRAQLHTQYAIS